MNVAYRDALGEHGASLVTHIGLVDDGGAEFSGSPYVRKAVTWTTSADGLIRPTEDLLFNIPSGGKIVGGWRGYSAVAGGTDYGGGSVADVTYMGAGYYVLKADETAIKHEAS